MNVSREIARTRSTTDLLDRMKSAAQAVGDTADYLPDLVHAIREIKVLVIVSEELAKRERRNMRATLREIKSNARALGIKRP